MRSTLMNVSRALVAVAVLAATEARTQDVRPPKDYRDYALRRDGDAGRGRDGAG